MYKYRSWNNIWFTITIRYTRTLHFPLFFWSFFQRGHIRSFSGGIYSIEPADTSKNNTGAFDHILRRINSNDDGDETSSVNRNNCGTIAGTIHFFFFPPLLFDITRRCWFFARWQGDSAGVFNAQTGRSTHTRTYTWKFMMILKSSNSNGWKIWD